MRRYDGRVAAQLCCIALLAVGAFLAGCSKPTSTDTNDAASRSPNAPAEPKPFRGQVFRSVDGNTILTLVSHDECELTQRGSNLLCKYTKQDGALRIVVTAFGTTQAVYFREVAEGLSDQHGNILLTPAARDAREHRAQAEAQRLADLRASATRETSTLGTFQLQPYKYAKFPAYPESHISPHEIVVTDVSLKWHVQYTPYQKTSNHVETVNFLNIAEVSSVVFDSYFNIYSFSVTFKGDQPNIESGTVYSKTEAEAKSAREAIVGAWRAWRAKFAEVAR